MLIGQQRRLGVDSVRKVMDEEMETMGEDGMERSDIDVIDFLLQIEEELRQEGNLR